MAYIRKSGIDRIRGRGSSSQQRNQRGARALARVKIAPAARAKRPEIQNGNSIHESALGGIMEVGQVLHNNSVGLETSDFTEALISAIRDEIARVYWNVNQRPWKGAGPGNIGHLDHWSEEWHRLSYDTGIPGIEWRGYYNWGGSPEDEDWDQAEASAPNFSFEGVEVRWYKHFGRSMSANVCWPADKWQRWFERARQTLRAHEQQSKNWNHGADIIQFPDPAEAVSLEATVEDLRYLELLGAVKTIEAQLNCIACVCIDVADGKKPRFEKEDWRWCKALDWAVRLGRHALRAPGKLRLHEDKDAM